ncbi:MAG: NAD(P)H-dependent oxidoreductase [Rhodobacteraceae bacterium]|nr:NAD(P)H-dependent oxidoreductase [Paracoccaceae bacterium]
MNTLLRLDASIRGDASISRRLTDRLVAQLATPDTRVMSRDLSQGLTPIDGGWLSAIFSPAETRTDDQALIVAQADALLAELRAADTVVIGLPIYNFGVPATLKTWFDMLARKGETFTYTEQGPKGLLTGKRAFVALSSDGTELGGPIDFASGYVRHMLGFFGITDVTFVAADKMLFGADAAMERAETAIDQIAA